MHKGPLCTSSSHLEAHKALLCGLLKNHPLLGKAVSQEVRDQISKNLTGRKLTLEHIQNIREGSKKKAIFCYDYSSKEFVTTFSSVRSMARELNLSSIVLIQQSLRSRAAQAHERADL